MLSPPVRTHLPHTLLDAQHKLDEEIFRLEAHIVSLKVARNALSPISQLYPEILQEIFFLTHISSKQFSRGKASLTLTWVSHMWRDLAQSTSDLWTYIDFKDQKWIQAAVSLTRDRELCFDLNFASGQPWREKHLFGSFYLSHLHRTKTLEIHGLFQVSTRLYLNAIPEWTTPAPILGSLILDCVAIPRNVFSGFCPHLQLLHLMSCKVDWATLPTLIGLKDLHISMPEQRMTVHHLVDVLRSVAITLERLKFCDLLESSESTPDTGVRLQTLKMLSIQADDSNLIKEFLNQISFPPRTKTEISAPWDPAVLEAVTSSKNTSGWETDRLEFNASREGKLQTRKTGSDLQTSQSGDDSDISITNIQSVSVEDTFAFSDFGDLQWLSYFDLLGTIREFRISESFINRFAQYIDAQMKELRALLGDEMRPLDQPTLLRAQDILSFHKLRILEIHNFTDTILNWKSPFPLSEDNAISLYTWLQWRNKLGLRLNKLVLSEMVIKSESWAHRMFDEVVDELELVGITEYSGSESEDTSEVEDGDDIEECDDVEE